MLLINKTKCLQRKDENMIALILINNICYLKNKKQKNSKRKKTYLNEAIDEKQEQQKCMS